MSQQQSTIANQVVRGTFIGAALYVVLGVVIDELFSLMQIKLMPHGVQCMFMIPVAATLGGFAGWSVGARSHNRFSQAKVASTGGGLSVGGFVLWLWLQMKPRHEPSNFTIFAPLMIGIALLLLWGIALLFKRHKFL